MGRVRLTFNSMRVLNDIVGIILDPELRLIIDKHGDMYDYPITAHLIMEEINGQERS